MVWLYVPGLEGSSSELNESLMNIKPWLSWRGKPSRLQTWSKRWKTVPWLKRLSGLTCEPSTASRGAEKWISSLPDSHANLSQKLESVKEPGMTATFGPRFQGSLARFDPQSLSWRTCQASLMPPGWVSLETCPKWGMILRGELFELQTPAHIIDVRDSLPSRSVPTPTCMDTRSGQPRKVVQQSLEEGNWRGVGLRDFVQMFPTPTTIHAERGNHNEPVKNYLQRVEDYHQRKIKGKPGMSLGVAVRMFPIPTSQDPSFENLTNGKLNPEWVEWLMGWPIGWTACGPVETESCHIKPSSPSESS